MKCNFIVSVSKRERVTRGGGEEKRVSSLAE